MEVTRCPRRNRLYRACRGTKPRSSINSLCRAFTPSSGCLSSRICSFGSGVRSSEQRHNISNRGDWLITPTQGDKNHVESLATVRPTAGADSSGHVRFHDGYADAFHRVEFTALWRLPWLGWATATQYQTGLEVRRYEGQKPRQRVQLPRLGWTRCSRNAETGARLIRPAGRKPHGDAQFRTKISGSRRNTDRW